MTHAELQALEVELEKDAVTAAVERYRARLADEGASATTPGLTLIKRAMEPVIEQINADIDRAKAGRAGRAVTIMQFLDQFEPDVLAFAGLRAAIDGASREEQVLSAADSLGLMLEMQVNYEQLKDARPDVYDYMMRQRHHTSGTGNRWLVMRHKSRWAGLKEVKWGQRQRAQVGAYLIEQVIASAGIVETVLAEGAAQRDAVYRLRYTEGAAEWLAQAHAACEVQRPTLYPMVIPPLPWTTTRDGGYLNHRYPLIKAPMGTTLGELDQQDMPAVLDAANALQSTAYRINARLARTLREALDTGAHAIPDLPVEANLPPKPDEPAGMPPMGEELNEEQRAILRAWKRKAHEWYTQRARIVQMQAGARAKLAVAERLADVPAIYFPVVADWRGRMYYRAQPLNPQGDDLAKGLLEFSEGQPLGENGAYWLAVHVANSFGVDKAPFNERVQWVNDHRADILYSGIDPLGERGGLWMKADAPWVFLSAAMEYARLAMHVAHGGKPGDFLSHTIVSMDGSCNGLQHLSALLLDPVGGAAVNLVPAERPADIYTQVAKRTSALVEMDLADPEKAEHAQAWVGRITRKLVKRNTMTVPYAVTSFGMAKQLAQEVQDMRRSGNDPLPGVKKWFDACNYLAKRNHEAICSVVVAARDVMVWLQKCAQVAAKAELPIYWQAPSGFIVVQAYREAEADRFETTLAGKPVKLTLRVLGTKLSKRKQASGVAPNFIHSMDAAHLVATVNMLHHEGVKDFAGVHDSFGVHAGNVDLMNVVLREEFSKMHTPDLLQSFRDQLVEQLPPEVAKDLPPTPVRGTLDLQGVHDSEYFFA